MLDGKEFRDQREAKRELETFRKLIGPRKIMIADASSTTRSGVFRILTDIGIKPFQILLANSFEAALEVIAEHRPEIVISEYDLGRRCGLELLQLQREANPEMRKSVFVLITSNSSQTAVARAAEEDVDAYLLKPFTPETVRTTLVRTITLKINPPPYFREIEAGKEQLVQGKPESAEKHFVVAMKLDTHPALACYYLGQVQSKMQVEVQAMRYFEEGLNHNRLHYKCLVSLYEIYLKQGRQQEAYDLARRISDYFPANPKRLMEVLRLAVVNQAFDDVEKYYKVFLTLDERSDALVTHVCAALVVAGKFHLRNENIPRCVEFFQKAAITCAGRTRILREIVQSLIDFSRPQEADVFLKRFPPDEQKSESYLMLDFQIANLSYSAMVVLQRGRDLLNQKMGNERFYEIMIARALEYGLLFAAENLVHDAAHKFPERSEKFENMLLSIKKVAPSKATPLR